MAKPAFLAQLAKRGVPPVGVHERQELREYGDRLQAIFAVIEAMPESPGRTEALAALLYDAWKLEDAIVNYSSETREQVMALHDLAAAFELSDGSTASEQRAIVKKELARSLALEGALFSRAADRYREQGGALSGVIRVKIEPPAYPVTSLPAPHFVEPFIDGEDPSALLQLARIGFTSSQLRAAYGMIEDEQRGRKGSDSGALSSDSTHAALLAWLGEFHLAQALMFESRREAAAASLVFALLPSSDRQRMGEALAKTLRARPLGKPAPLAEEFLLKTQFERPEMIGRAKLNAGRRADLPELLPHLRVYEAPCFRNHMIPYEGPPCRSFDWFWGPLP